MKKLLLLIALVAGISSTGYCRIQSDVSAVKDSIVILFGKKTQIVIHSQDKEELRKLKNYNFNQLMDQVITLMEAQESNTTTKSDTSLVVDGDTVVIRGSRVIIKDKDTNEEVAITIKIGKRKDDNDRRSKDDTTVIVVKSKEKRFKRTESEFIVDLGLNNYLEKGKFPDEADKVYGLRPWGSRYIAFGHINKTRIGNRKSPLALHYGLELSVNNFMFEGDSRIRKGPDGILFEPTGRDLRKNKLTVFYINLPVMTFLDFNKPNWGNFEIGFGGYVGYRLHSYSKIMYFESGREREHQRSNFHLNNLRYGLVGQIGLKGLSLFVKYDLNPLFVQGKGPNPNADLQAISFGIRL